MQYTSFFFPIFLPPVLTWIDLYPAPDILLPLLGDPWDALLLTAQGVETIERKDENKLRKTCARIEEIVKEYEVSTIVLGLPKNMNNTEGERVEKTKEFGEMLERRTGLPVVYWDERLTTVAAEQVLMETGVRRENRKAVIDKIAACFILQGYLDRMSAARNDELQTESE